MLLSERELENIVGDALGEALQGYLNTGVTWTEVCMKAAHAIAEKLAKGVVWEGMATWYEGGSVDTSGIKYDGEHPAETIWSSESGQLVTVTVRTREESDGPRMD